jgi:hypothetical protein
MPDYGSVYEPKQANQYKKNVLIDSCFACTYVSSWQRDVRLKMWSSNLTTLTGRLKMLETGLKLYLHKDVKDYDVSSTLYTTMILTPSNPSERFHRFGSLDILHPRCYECNRLHSYGL